MPSKIAGDMVETGTRIELLFAVKRLWSFLNRKMVERISRTRSELELKV